MVTVDTPLIKFVPSMYGLVSYPNVTIRVLFSSKTCIFVFELIEVSLKTIRIISPFFNSFGNGMCLFLQRISFETSTGLELELHAPNSMPLSPSKILLPTVFKTGTLTDCIPVK